MLLKGRGKLEPKMRIGIFGGSFNPVHEGHLELAQEALSQLNLSKVIFVPSFETPLKSKPSDWSVPKRIQKLEAVLKDYPFFELSLYEAHQKKISYTINTLRYFRKKVSEETVLYFLAGADVVGSLNQWKDVDAIFKICQFVVFSRPGFLPQKSPYPVVYLNMKPVAISSTQIREEKKT